MTFGVGQRTKTITVAATDDVLDDDGESVSLGFFNDHRDRVITGHGSITATVALEDNDGNERVDVSFGAAAYKATEGGTDATVEVKLDAAPGRSVEIPLVATRQGGASAADYSGIPASVTFGAEETSKTIDVTATVDVGGDGGESVRLEFGELPASVFAGSPAAAVVTLFDSNTNQGVGFVVSFGTAQTVLVRESSTVRHRFGVYGGTRWQPGSGRPSKPVTIPLVVTHRGATEDDHYGDSGERDVRGERGRLGLRHARDTRPDSRARRGTYDHLRPAAAAGSAAAGRGQMLQQCSRSSSWIWTWATSRRRARRRSRGRLRQGRLLPRM